MVPMQKKKKNKGKKKMFFGALFLSLCQHKAMESHDEKVFFHDFVCE